MVNQCSCKYFSLQLTTTLLLKSVEGKRLFHDQSPRKYGTRAGSNSLPLDLQSDTYLQPDTLPTALRGPGINSLALCSLSSHKLTFSLQQMVIRVKLNNVYNHSNEAIWVHILCSSLPKKNKQMREQTTKVVAGG